MNGDEWAAMTNIAVAIVTATKVQPTCFKYFAAGGQTNKNTLAVIIGSAAYRPAFQ